MQEGYPKFRSDLVSSRQESPTGIVYVIKDPAVNRFFRLRETEYFIVRQFDGTTPAAEVRRRSEERFGAALPEDTLERFTNRLRTLGLLETTVPRGGDAQSPARIRGNPLYLRFHAFDPDRFFARLIQHLPFFFTKTFVVLSAAFVVLALAIVVAEGPGLRLELSRLSRPGALVMVWLTLIGVTVLHELAHGLTCKRFGGRVHEMGFLLLFMQPTMYCNVSDSWLFPEKSKRLWVTFAGAYFEIFLWAIATVIWRVTDPAVLVNFLALVVMATSGVKTLFNLNPLIKLDGYYLLSDWLEIPNLRGRSSAYIGRRLREMLRGQWRASQSVPARERRIFWLYGMTAWAYTVWLLGWVLLWVGETLTARYQAWGLVLFCAIVGIMFQDPLRRAAASLGSSFDLRAGVPQTLKRLARVATGAAMLGALFYFVTADLKVSGEFTVLPARKAEIRSEIDGIIAEILVDEGNRVNPGDPIARLGRGDITAELNQINAEIDDKQARLRMLKAGARQEEIDVAKTAVEKAQERLEFARTFLAMEARLHNDKLSSRKDYELARESAGVREKELEEATGILKLLLAGSRPEEIEATAAEINRLNARRNHLEDQSSRLTISSPIAGLIVTHQIKDKIGQRVRRGDLVAQVHEIESVAAEILVPENEVSVVREGQPIVLKARAHPGKSFESTVASIAPVAKVAAEDLGQRQFIVTARLDNPDLLLRPEMSGNAKIHCGERRLYEIFFRRMVRYLRTEFWSWW